MTPAELDRIFPWIVLAYGALVAVALSSERVLDLGERFVPAEAWRRFRSHRPLAYVCFAVGALWILQNLWVG